LSLTLAVYVGEDVTIRFDLWDMGEIHGFYRERFHECGTALLQSFVGDQRMT